MKIQTLRRLLAGLVGVACGMFATQTMAGTIVGSPHDFSSQGWSGGQICVACHTPHNSDTTVTDAPLWNHDVTTATYTMYSRSSIDGTVGTAPGSVSLLCLSCHDGTVAIDAYGGATGTTFFAPTAPQNLGTDLSNDHPISISYNATTAATDGGLHNPTTTTVTIGDAADNTRTGTITDIMLTSGEVQCSSCHDVHNTFTVAGAGGDPLLKVSKLASALCLTCHDK